jgi:hypothetical protein
MQKPPTNRWLVQIAFLLASAATALGQLDPSSTPGDVPLWPPEQHLHLPLVVVDASSFTPNPASNPSAEPPFATLGSLPESATGTVYRQPWAYTFDNKTFTAQPFTDTFPRPDRNVSKSASIVTGHVPFSGASANAPTLLLLAAPLSRDSTWVPTDITLAGRTLTLHAYACDLSNVDLRAAAALPPDSRSLYLISLSQLPAGQYTLDFDCRWLVGQQPEPGAPFNIQYQWMGRRDVASLPFAVGADAGGAPATLALDQIKTSLAKIAPPTGTEILPQYWCFYGNSMPPRPALQVGYLDSFKYAEACYSAATQALFPPPVPKTTPPRSGGRPVAVVTSPTLNSGEWLALESLEYLGQECRLTVGLWRDNTFDRAKNIIHADTLLVPLEHLASGHYTVSVVWHDYNAIGFIRQNNNVAYTSTNAYALAPGQTPPISANLTVR